jgi:hypothetical protein
MFLSGFLIGFFAYAVVVLSYAVWKNSGGQQWGTQFG